MLPNLLDIIGDKFGILEIMGVHESQNKINTKCKFTILHILLGVP
jgi:hypothetical protein